MSETNNSGLVYFFLNFKAEFCFCVESIFEDELQLTTLLSAIDGGVQSHSRVACVIAALHIKFHQVIKPLLNVIKRVVKIEN